MNIRQSNFRVWISLICNIEQNESIKNTIQSPTIITDIRFGMGRFSSMLWIHIKAGAVSSILVLWVVSLVFSAHLVGNFFVISVLKGKEQFNSLPTKFLFGLLLSNAFLFLALLILPFRLNFDWWIYVVITLTLGLKVHKNTETSSLESSIPDYLFFLLAPIAVTIWCRELLMPIEINGEFAIIKAWQDVFYHLSQITSFASSKGLASIYDVQMASAPMHPYHIASYLLPATFAVVTNSSALVAYSSLLVSLGLLMSLLGAYTLVQTMYGKWPALASSLALVLLPDAYQQGFENHFFSYHWLMQVAPAQGYAMGSAAVAFAIIIIACKSESPRLVLVSYFFILMTLLYKAQIFVAVSFLALVYPLVMMPKILFKIRILFILGVITLYVAVIVFSQSLSSIPILKLDWSSVFEYTSIVMINQEHDLLRDVFEPIFTMLSNKKSLAAITLAVFLLLVTFGASLSAYLIAYYRFKKRYSPLVLLMPLAVVIVYLLMSTGLAMDTRQIGGREELLHRPFVWAYFIVLISTVGLIYHYKFGDNAPSSSGAKILAVVGVIALMSVPFYYGKEIQTFKLWKVGYQEVPLCLLASTNYIKSNSGKFDVVQDSLNDSSFFVSGMTERRPFVIDTKGFRVVKEAREKQTLLSQLKSFKDAKLVNSFMLKHGIQWYLLQANDKVDWGIDILNHEVFECGGYKVYRF